MIVATEDPARLARIVRAAFNEQNRYILNGDFACFVSFSGSSQELSNLLDLEGTNKKEDRPCPAVITSVTTYGGFAPTSLWEWLNDKKGSSKAPLGGYSATERCCLILK